MRNLRQEKEEFFHDEWAKSISPEEINVLAKFEGKTTPEYRELIGFLGKVRNKKVLNLGCGLGEEAVYLHNLGARVTAVDISSLMLKAAKRLARKHRVGRKISFLPMTAESLKFKRGSFEAVVGCNILHHVDLKKTIREVKRVLKPGGVAAFLEPLAYNPVINIYRIMATKVRTPDERPLDHRDFEEIKKVFPKMARREFQLCTLLIFVWFFVGEFLHPNKVRYWRKIIIEEKQYAKAFAILAKLDQILLGVLPGLRKYCWVTVIRLEK